MAQILDMPQLADTMRQGVLRKWRKREGDTISPGEVLAEATVDAVAHRHMARPAVEADLLRRVVDGGVAAGEEVFVVEIDAGLVGDGG